jgi:hypothetical protein
MSECLETSAAAVKFAQQVDATSAAVRYDEIHQDPVCGACKEEEEKKEKRAEKLSGRSRTQWTFESRPEVKSEICVRYLISFILTYMFSWFRT